MSLLQRRTIVRSGGLLDNTDGDAKRPVPADGVAPEPGRRSARTPPELTAASEWWWVAAITAAGGVLRAHRLGWKSFWLDEYWTWAFASEPWARLLGPDARIDTTPPYYYLLTKLWLPFGDSPEAMRTLPLILGVTSIPLVFVIGKRLAASRAGLAAATLWASFPLALHYSREIRCYSLLTFSALVAVACVAHLVPQVIRAEDRPWLGDTQRGVGVLVAPASPTRTKPRRAWLLWAGYVLSATSTVYAHNTAVLLPLLLSVWVAGLWAARIVDGRFVLQWVAANAIVALLYSWWLLTLVDQTRTAMKQFWIPKSTWSWVRSQLLGTYPYEKWLKPVVGFGLVAGVWALRRRPVALGLLLTLVVGQPLMLFLLSLARHVLIVRALFWPTAFGLVLLGAAIAQLRSRPRFVTALALLTAGSVYSARREYSSHIEPSPMAPLARVLGSFQAGQDAVVLAPMENEWELRYEARRSTPALQGFGVTAGDHRVWGALDGQWERWSHLQHVARADVASVTQSYERVWLIRQLRPPEFVTTPGMPRPPNPFVEEAFDRLEPALAAGRQERRRVRSGDYELVLLEKAK